MKKMLKQSLALASFAAVASAAFAGITETPHNLTTSNTSGPNTQTNTGQICVFCHTPHASNTEATAPLWNKKLPSNAAYSVYNTQNSSTVDGQVLAIGSVSAACLSCHDGTQAMDNLVNAPGSGGYNSAGSDRNYTWTGNAAGTGKIGAARVANLGQDLRNDHPIGIAYCGGGLSSTQTDKTNCKDTDFKSINTKTVNGKPVFWIDTSTGDTVRTKSDIILYTRDFSLGNSTPSVECASCHDPHVGTSVGSGGGAAPDVNFMRVTTAGSKICLACHTK